MIGLTTVASKNNNNTVADKVIQGNTNIGEVLVILKEALESEVKYEVDIIEYEKGTKVDVE